MFKRICTAAALAAVVATTASAADSLPPARSYKPYVAVSTVYNWAGFYAGVNGGGAWATGMSGGFLAGGQLGWNHMFDNRVVLGLRTELGYNSVKGSGTSCLSGVCATETAKAPLFGSTVALLGYSPASAPQWLLYGVGGLAYTNVKYDMTLSGALTGTASGNSWKAGPLVGGGVGYAFGRNWSISVEYNHAWFRGDTQNFTIPPVIVTTTNPSTGVNIVKLALNYRF